MPLKRLFRAAAPPVSTEHRLPPGRRIYAIGDVHGRLDLLDALLLRIGEDDRNRPDAETLLILLGDLVDRGPDSRGVVERCRTLAAEAPSTIFLKGNHEEILIRAYRGDRQAAGLFHRVGGRETMLSYGVSAAEYDRCDLPELATLLQQRIPPEHIAFLDGFMNMFEAGDYLFVHAGVRPGILLADQRESDLRWIRRDFLDYRGSHGKLVVHGHNISPEVDEQPNRIGIDTGAFASGTLTALAIEADRRWYLTGSV